jgi:hypothetical protein
LPVVIASDQSAVTVADGGGSLTIDSTQLPAALVGGRFDINTGAWLGSTAPTVGQKTMANSLPVVIASDQSSLPVSFSTTDGTASATLGALDAVVSIALVGKSGVGFFKPAVAMSATLSPELSFDSGTTWVSTVFVEPTTGVQASSQVIVLSATVSKQILIWGGATHARVRVSAYTSGSASCTLTTTSSIGRVDSNIGAWFGSISPTVGSKTSANSIPVVVASDQGAVAVKGAGTAGVSDTNVVTVQGIASGTALPVSSTFANMNVTTAPAGQTTATLSNVSGSASSVTLLASNANRKGATIVNDSSAILYVKFGSTASTTSYTVRMVSNAYYEVPFNYSGIITGIWASATGAARVTEITA